jgi:hypothetical protein
MKIKMDPHPLANLFKRSNYDEPIATEFSVLDYFYEVLLENHESGNCDEVLKEEIYKVVHDSSFNEKHDCNGVIINSINVNCVNDMQNYKLGDDNFVMSTTYCNDHDWGDNSFYDLENLFKPHDEYVIDNKICNTIKSGFGRASTLGNNDPTILDECQLCFHVDHDEKILYDSYIVEFEYDPTCNYYERGKYGCRNFHVANLPLFMLRLLLFPFSLHMLDFACLDDFFAYKMPMHRMHVRLRCVFHKFFDALFVFQSLSFG